MGRGWGDNTSQQRLAGRPLVVCGSHEGGQEEGGQEGRIRSGFGSAGVKGERLCLHQRLKETLTFGITVHAYFIPWEADDGGESGHRSRRIFEGEGSKKGKFWIKVRHDNNHSTLSSTRNVGN